MRKNCFLLLASLVGAVLISGCVSTVDGRREAGVPFLRDRVEGRYERPPMDVWAAAKDVLAFNGTLYGEDTLRSTLEASVDSKTVWVKVEAVDPKITKVTVQVRAKGGGTDLALAGEIDKEIAVRLATGNLTPATRALKK